MFELNLLLRGGFVSFRSSVVSCCDNFWANCSNCTLILLYSLLML